MKIRSLLAGTCLMAISSVAHAQSTGPVDSSAEESSPTEIIVTAQRRAERLQDVPVSVAAVSEETLRSRGINDLTQVSLAAPSLQVSEDNNYSVRGVGTLAFAQTLESSVAIAQDEVNLASSILGGGTFYDVARVEVLNGPQGLLFGKNASAGLLNVVTRKPVLGQFGGEVSAEGTWRDTVPGNSYGIVTRGTLNIPVGDNSALRLNALYSSQDPATRFVGTGPAEMTKNDFGLRAKFLTEFSDSASFYLIADYAEEHGVGGLFDRTYRQLAAGSGNLGPLTSDGIVVGPNNLLVAGDGGFSRDVKRGGVTGTLSYTFASGFELSNITAWKGASRNQQLDVDFTSSNGANINRSDTDYNQFTNELRLALPNDGPLTGQVGLYYFQANTKVDAQIAGNALFPAFLLPSFPFCVGATVTAGPPPACNVSNSFFLGNDRRYDLDSKSYAAFGQFTYAVSDNFKLIAGGRVTHDKIDIDLNQNTGSYFVLLGIPATRTESASNTNFSYRLGAQYNFSRDVMAYATFGRGYKGPGFNDNLVAPTASLVVRPETADNIEIGLKSSLLDRKLVVNVALFRTKFKDYQSQAFDLTTSSFVVQNAASLTSKGAELSVIAIPVEGLTINANASLLDSKFDDYPGAQCYPGQPNCPTGQFNAGGLRAPVSPKFTTTIQATYEREISPGLKAFIEGNYYHRSSVSYTINQAPGTSIGGIDLLGASVGLRSENGWRFSLFCKNCTDKRYPLAIGLDAGDAAGGLVSTIQSFGANSVRTFGLQVGFEF